MPIEEHHHLIVQAWVANPILDPREGEAWLLSMIEAIGMTLLAPPQAVYSDMPGNRGLTVSALITTSHVVLHLWDEDRPAELQLDVYSCKAYSKEIIFERIKERFAPLSVRYKFIDRRHGLSLFNEDHH